MHVPVWEEISPFDKIDIESQLTGYSSAGCITYVELEGAVLNNIDALEQIVIYAMDKDIPYFALNVPNDLCTNCGYTGVIDDECPMCGGRSIQRLRRVTGYLTGDYKTAFNLGKQHEVEDRYKHSNKLMTRMSTKEGTNSVNNLLEEEGNMKNYTKPVAISNEELAEGVYTSSGDEGCYTTTAYIHQQPEIGRGDYRIQVNGIHKADHTKEKQWLFITFNMPVVYKSSNGSLVNGDGTNTLEIEYAYHQNPTDNIGLGDLVVEADAGLAIAGVKIID
jgi:hypothetical protein